ncbi:unnamed protein product, partial [Adineta steineri]
MLILVAISVIFINTFVLTRRDQSTDQPHENSHKVELVHNQNHTIKPLKPDQIEPQRIQRPAAPDAGK